MVREAFIEGKIRSEEQALEKDGYNVRWTMENGLGLVFVVRIAKKLLGFAAEED